MSDSKEFWLKEYESLWAVKNSLVAERRRVETGVILGNVAVYSWIFTRTAPIDTALFRASLIVPIVFAVFGFIRYLGIQFQMRNIVTYSQPVELILQNRKIGAFNVAGGWEMFIENARTNGNVFRRARIRLESLSELLVWCLLIAATSLVARYFWCYEFTQLLTLPKSLLGGM